MAFEIEIFLDALQFKNGILVGLAMWQLALKMFMAFFNDKLKLWMEEALPSERDKVNAMLNSFTYRFIVFVLNSFLSVKLPTTARKSTGNTVIITQEQKERMIKDYETKINTPGNPTAK